MRKAITMAVATMAIAALFAVSAFAQYGIGGAPAPYNDGKGWNRAHRMGGAPFCAYYNSDGTPVVPVPGEVVINSDDDAKNAVDKVLKANFKGYKITETVSFDTNSGKAYFVYTNDASDNVFTFAVGPFGHVRGPMTGKVNPQQMPMGRGRW